MSVDVVILLLLLKQYPYTIDCNQHFKTSLESTSNNITDTQVFVPIEKKSVAWFCTQTHKFNQNHKNSQTTQTQPPEAD